MATLFTEIPSTRQSEKYAWLGDIPGLKEWIGNKSLSSLRDYDYTIKNRDWYTGFEVDRNDLEDQQISAYQPRVDALAQVAAEYRFKLITQLILDGDSGLAFDGQAFFANRTAPNDNLLAGTGVTFAALKADVTSTRASMMRFETGEGTNMGLIMNKILCPPELEATFLEVTTATGVVIGGQGTAVNPVASWGIEVIPMPELTDTGDWYGFATNRPLRPFIFQNRKNPVPVLDETTVKQDRKIAYSVEMRAAAGYGFPQMAVKVVNT
jgi:phage major head subunit gpT-like protein